MLVNGCLPGANSSFATSWNFLSNTFHLCLVEPEGAKPAGMEGQLCSERVFSLHVEPKAIYQK